MRLMTNNPAKRGGLEGFGLDIVERVPLEPIPTPEHGRCLRTERDLEQAGGGDDLGSAV
jgi:3,4-dihydroxy 2-butanone 4-phosphate synthase/GTP cyclohydrolase II